MAFLLELTPNDVELNKVNYTEELKTDSTALLIPFKKREMKIIDAASGITTPHLFKNNQLRSRGQPA